MTTKTFVSVEHPLRDWLRSNSVMQAVTGQRVFVGTPKAEATVAAAGPFITLFLVTDPPIPGGGAPWSSALIQFDCYGATRQDASRASYTLKSVLESMDSGTLLDASIRCGGATVTRHQWFPDTSAPIQPRYSVDAVLLVVATGQ